MLDLIKAMQMYYIWLQFSYVTAKDSCCIKSCDSNMTMDAKRSRRLGLVWQINQGYIDVVNPMVNGLVNY